jgi:uncharacterized protein YegJ (DUF2314 family)
MTKRLIIAALLIAASPLGGCWGVPNHDRISEYSTDDPEMNAAKAEGQRRLPEFFAALAAGRASDSDFMLKFDLNQNPDDPEYIWADSVRFTGDQISGRLANNPMNEAFAEGQMVPIRRSDIIDWGFFRDGVMQGNFTTRVQLIDMPPEEAAAIRQNFGW